MVDVPFYYTEAFWVMIAAFAAAAAAIFSAIQTKWSKSQVEQLKTQIDESKKVTELQVSLHIFQRLTKLYEDPALSSGTFEDEMQKFVSDPKHKDTTLRDLPLGAHDYKTATARLLGFYEEVGHYLYHHRQFREILLSIVGDEPSRMWDILSSIVENERKKFNDKNLYSNYEYLVNEIKKGTGKNHS